MRASQILFKEDFEGVDQGTAFIFDPSVGPTIKTGAFLSEAGQISLGIGNNGSISEGLAGSQKGFKMTDGGAQGAGAIRVMGVLTDKVFVHEIKSDQRLQFSFDVRFDGEFTNTPLNFTVFGYDQEDQLFPIASLNMMAHIKQLTASNDPTDARPSILLGLSLDTDTEYHIALLFNFADGTYDIAIFKNGDRKTPYFYETGLSCVTRNSKTHQPLEFLKDNFFDVGTTTFGSSGAVLFDNPTLEVVDAPKEDATAWIAGTKIHGIRIFGEGERRAMVRGYHAKMAKEREMHPSTLKEWDALRGDLKKKMMDGFGLDPLPPKVPLDLTYGGALERADCTITRVMFQTFPGLYASGYLYMPKNTKFPAPAIFHPHGHWSHFAAGERVHSRCIALARRGYISLAIQFEHFEDLPSGLTKRGVFLYNNIRALDVLASLPEVDKTRIGVTGASGGGMQTADLAALDERIKVTVEVVFNSYYKRILTFVENDDGDCCWSSPLGALKYMDQHWILALAAPRPLAVLSDTGDWTAHTIHEEMPQVARIYDLYEAKPGPHVESVLGEEPYQLMTSQNGRFLVERFQTEHDYTQAMRERMVWWMDWWLKDEHKPLPEPEGDLALEKPETLVALKVEPPKGEQWSHTNLAKSVRPQRMFQPPKLTNKSELLAFTSNLHKKLEGLVGSPKKPTDWKQESKDLGEISDQGWTLQKRWFTSEPGVRIPALWVHSSHQKNPSQPVTIFVSVNGKNDIFKEPMRSLCQSLLDQGRSVLAIDPRMRGEWTDEMELPGVKPKNTWQAQARLWGRPEVGAASDDIRAAIDYLESQKAGKNLEVVGYGQMPGMAALLAAARDERITRCVADCNNQDFRSSYENEMFWMLPGILRTGNIGEIAALVAPRKLELVNVSSGTSLSTVQDAYRLLGAENQFLSRLHSLEHAPVSQ